MGTNTAEAVTGAEVREWAIEKGLAKAGRGRLSAEAIKAFNKGHRRQYKPAK